MSPEECRARRLRYGLSVHEVASRAGLAEETVKRFEAASVAPRTNTLVALRRAFRSFAQDFERAW